MQSISTIGIVMPKDFAAEPYEAIHSRIISTKSRICSHAWDQYAGAWNAVAHRFRSFADHDKNFTDSVKRAGSAPPPAERHIQEHELFGYFVTGLAVVESFCYGLFLIGSIVNASRFPITTPEEMQNVYPEGTRDKFTSVFPEEDVTTSLSRTISSQEFQDWKVIRNVLIHRINPGRIIAAAVGSAKTNSQTLWFNGIQIDNNTTLAWRKWLAERLTDLLCKTDAFTANKL